MQPFAICPHFEDAPYEVLAHELGMALMRVKLEECFGQGISDSIFDPEHDLASFRRLISLHRSDLPADEQEEEFHLRRYRFWAEARDVKSEDAQRWVSDGANLMKDFLQAKHTTTFYTGN